MGGGLLLEGDLPSKMVWLIFESNFAYETLHLIVNKPVVVSTVFRLLFTYVEQYGSLCGDLLS